MVPLPPCKNCKQPARSACGRCRSVPICSRECLAAIWERHKAECTSIVETKKAIDQIQEALRQQPRQADQEEEYVGVLAVDTFLAINQRSVAVYDRHHLEEPPPKGSRMNSRKKLAFFLDMLREHDASSDANRELPLPAKMLLNRRFNNTYRHAVETFAPGELDRLNAMMRSNRVGAAFH